MRTAIVLKKPEVVVEGIAPTLQVNGEYILDDDAIYISMNNYNRISTVIKQTYSENVVIDVDTDDKGNKIEIKEIQSVTKPTVFEYFDVIHTNIASTFALFNKNTISIEVDIPTALFKNEYQQSAFDPNDTSVYILNPIEPSLKRFNIELRDKKNQLLKTSEIASFKMTICVYSKQKKF
jgi:5S rRNA maturation endonuclease (ribonuclease M5)